METQGAHGNTRHRDKSLTGVHWFLQMRTMLIGSCATMIMFEQIFTMFDEHEMYVH